MNYGYAAGPAERPLVLDEADEANRLCIQLYARALAGVELTDADVLEVGSGRGGGCSFVHRYRSPRSTTGLDFSRQAVDLSSRTLGEEKLIFVRGDALSMPFPDASFDAVINIESSHCYDSMPTFLTEVARVLRPAGTLALADFRSRAGLEQLRRELSDGPLQLIAESEITSNVLAALEIDDERKRSLINSLIPRPFRRPFRRFAGMRGSTTYERFADGSSGYLAANLILIGSPVSTVLR